MEGFGGFGLKTIGGRIASLGLKTRRGRFGGLSLKTTGRTVRRFVLKTRTKVPRRNGTTRYGITKVAWSSDLQKLGWIIMPLGYVVHLKISRSTSEII